MPFNIKNSLYLIFNMFNMLIYLVLSNESKLTGILFVGIVIILHIITIYIARKRAVLKVFTEYGRYVALYETILYFIFYVVTKEVGGNGSFIIFIVMLSKFLFYYVLLRQFESKVSVKSVEIDKAQSNLKIFARVLAVIFMGMIIFSSQMKLRSTNIYTILFIILIGIAVMYASEYLWYTYLFNSRKEKIEGGERI